MQPGLPTIVDVLPLGAAHEYKLWSHEELITKWNSNIYKFNTVLPQIVDSAFIYFQWFFTMATKLDMFISRSKSS